MKVLTVFAHPGSRSFCHAVLDRFDAGLRDAGHTNEIVDLYAIGFDPVMRPRDTPSWLTETVPDDMLDRMRLRESLLDEAGGPLQRFALKRLIGDRDARGIIRLLRERYRRRTFSCSSRRSRGLRRWPFVAPVHFLSFPAILKVLTVFAHPGSQSFCHAVLDRFDAGLRDAGHTNEIVDLYAIGFDPILRPRDTPSWLTETIPDDMLDRMRLRESLLDEAGGPLKRFALKRLIGDRDARGIIRLLRERYQPKDVLVQQQKVARAEALAFVAPVHFLSFPAILKGWLDRVWTPGFAYDLTPEAWRGDINGRQPKLTHKKALIIQTTIFDKRAYDAGLRDAMRMVIDEFTLTYPGIKNVEREYFYAVHGADDATRRGYLEKAYALGRQF